MSLQAGVAQREITPPIGTALIGYIARTGPATGVHDPLYARALLLADDDAAALLITCDLLGLTLAFVQRVRAAIAAAIGIPANHVLICCSHTHAGPATLFLQDCGTIDEAYLGWLQQELVGLAAAAKANEQPARFGVGQGQVTTGYHNRRTPGDVVDPALGVLSVADGAGKLLAIVLNFACHPTCLGADNQLISAEYCGVATATLAAATGATVLFITGAIGDVGPIARGWAMMNELGQAIAEEALRVLHTIAHQSWAGVAVRQAELRLPLLPLPTVEQVRAAVDQFETTQATADAKTLPLHPKIPAAMRAWGAATIAALQSGRAANDVTSEVQLIQLRGLTLVSAPGELFVELGLAIKAVLSPQPSFIGGFGNDNVGYLPARRAYVHGGYEIMEAYKYYGYPAALAPEAGELLVEAVKNW